MTSLFNQYHHLRLTSCVPSCFTEWKFMWTSGQTNKNVYVVSAWSETSSARSLNDRHIRPKDIQRKMCVLEGKRGGGRGNQRICLGLRHGLVWERGGACLGERGDCDESGNHGDPREPSFRGGKHPAASSTRCKFLHCYRTLMQLKLWMSKWIRHRLKRGKPPVSRRPGLRFRPTFSEPMQDFPSL